MAMRDEVVRFAERMEENLQQNDHKGGWQYCSPKWLLNRLRQETGELTRAIERGNAERIVSEAADVANFAMMIADVIAAAQPEGKKCDCDYDLKRVVRSPTCPIHGDPLAAAQPEEEKP